MVPTQILHAAAPRHGVAFTAELDQAGLGSAARDRRVRDGQLLRPYFGVYLVAELQDRLTPVAAVQAAFPFLVAERRAAALVWDLDSFRDLPDPIADLACIEPGRRTRSRGRPVFRNAAIPAQAVTTHEGIRVTTPTWTLGELGAVVPDTDRVELAMECALFRGLTTEAKLQAVVNTRNGDAWPGTATLLEALSRRSPGAPPTESYAETRFLQLIVRPAGLDDPERQVPIRVPGRRQPYRRDFVYRRGARELDVEVDGMASHAATPAARERDLQRDELVIEAGCAVRRYSASRIEHQPEVVRRSLVTALAQLSY